MGKGSQDSGPALIWDAIHGVRDLQDVLTHDYGLGENFGDYSHGGAGILLEARFISADGRTIAGTGRTWRLTNGNSLLESWVAVLDVPVTMVMPGDIDLDGTIDRGDVAKFTTMLGTTTAATWQTGDFNRDGTTTLTDLALLSGNLGWSMSSPIGSPAAAVPEPATMFLAATTLALLLILNHRGRRGTQRKTF